jgi:hypothetical protein
MGILGDGSTASGQGAGEGGSPAGGQPGGGQNAGGGSSTPPPAAAGSGAQSTWLDSLPDDLKSNTGLQQFSDVQNLAKSWVHAQSMIGKKGVIPPGEKASEEEYAKFYKELGLPEMDKYGIEAPKDVQVNPEFMKSFKEIAHKAGIMPKQAQGLLNWYIQAEQGTYKAQQDAKAKAVTENLQRLKSEWGQGYDKNIALGDMALKELGGDELVDHVVKSGLAKDPVFIKLMAKVGGVLGEDKLRGEDGRRFGGQSPAELQKEIDRLFATPEYADTQHAGHGRAVQDMAELFKKLHG